MKKGSKEVGRLYVSSCKHPNGTVTYSVCEFYDWSLSEQLTQEFATEAEARAELEKIKKEKEKKMKSKVRIGVTITHYVLGQGNEYTSDITPLEVYEKTLNDQTLLEIAIDDYCEEFASFMTPFDTDWEEYILSFWLDDDRKVKSVLLSDYAHFFGRNL